MPSKELNEQFTELLVGLFRKSITFTSFMEQVTELEAQLKPGEGWSFRKLNYYPGSRAWSGYIKTRHDRVLLEKLIREGNGRITQAELARRYETESGMSICVTTVGAVIKDMGVVWKQRPSTGWVDKIIDRSVIERIILDDPYIMLSPMLAVRNYNKEAENAASRHLVIQWMKKYGFEVATKSEHYEPEIEERLIKRGWLTPLEPKSMT